MVWTICLLLKVFIMQVCVSQSVSEPDQFAKYDMIMSRMAEKMELMQTRIAYLERSEKSFKQSISALIGTNAQLRLKVQELETKQEAIAATLATTEKEESQQAENASNDVDTQPQQIADKTDPQKNFIQRKTRQLSGIVAFTSYLDHVLSLGNHQPIVFNKVILNEGNGYSNNTGIFRAPVPGIYLFSWAVTARRLSGGKAYDVWSRLEHNGVHIIGAVAESRDEADDNQGSNTAILRLAQGDEVWVSHDTATFQYVHGDTVERTSSFCGVQLFEVEVPSPVVG